MKCFDMSCAFFFFLFLFSLRPIADLRRDVLNRELRVAKIVSRRNIATDFSRYLYLRCAI